MFSQASKSLLSLTPWSYYIIEEFSPQPKARRKGYAACESQLSVLAEKWEISYEKRYCHTAENLCYHSKYFLVFKESAYKKAEDVYYQARGQTAVGHDGYYFKLALYQVGHDRLLKIPKTDFLSFTFLSV